VFTYQIRPRVFRHKPDEQLTFPSQCEMCFHFRPLQPFGMAAGGGRTGVQGVPSPMLFNLNTGEHMIELTKPLSPLDVTIREPSRVLRLAGNVFSVSGRFASPREMEEFIMGVYFALPCLLNVSFADPPYIEMVDGKVGSSSFRWELADWRGRFRITSQETQEEYFAKAWERMGVIAEPHRRRLAAGLHYFHVACRLGLAGATAGEFVAEVVLNLAKCLEVLFPPAGDGKTRDAARAGLRGLAYSEAEVERDFLPAMALRNEIDIGHVELGLFTMEQLKTIHAFTEQAEESFRQMLDRLLSRVASGEVEVASYELGAPSRDAIELVERLHKAQASPSAEE
jgi:hypothetical protein